MASRPLCAPCFTNIHLAYHNRKAEGAKKRQHVKQPLMIRNSMNQFSLEFHPLPTVTLLYDPSSVNFAIGHNDAT